MNKHQQVLNVFDHVRYVGDKHPNLRGTNAIGEIVGRTSDGLFSVSYGNDAYLLAPSNLRKVDYSEDTGGKLAEKWMRKAAEDGTKVKSK